MADTSLNENRLGLLIWQTSNIWQSKLRKILKNHKISLNEYLIIETLFKLSSLTKTVSQIRIANNSSLDVSVVSTNLTLLENKSLDDSDNIEKEFIRLKAEDNIVMGEVSLFSNKKKRTATVTALSDCIIGFLSNKDFASSIIVKSKLSATLLI